MTIPWERKSLRRRRFAGLIRRRKGGAGVGAEVRAWVGMQGVGGSKHLRVGLGNVEWSRRGIDGMDETDGRGVDQGLQSGTWQGIPRATTEKEDMMTGIATVVVIVSWTVMATAMTDEMIGNAGVPMTRA